MQCGGGASSSSSSNNAPRAPVRAPISPEAPPFHDHQRRDRFVPPSHTGAIHRRGNTYSGQQRGDQSSAPNGHYRNQRHDEGGSYGGHNPRGPGHNLYPRMPLPRLPGLVEQPFLPPPTSAWAPYVNMPPRAQAQPPVSLMGYNGMEASLWLILSFFFLALRVGLLVSDDLYDLLIQAVSLHTMSNLFHTLIQIRECHSTLIECLSTILNGRLWLPQSGFVLRLKISN